MENICVSLPRSEVVKLQSKQWKKKQQKTKKERCYFPHNQNKRYISLPFASKFQARRKPET